MPGTSCIQTSAFIKRAKLKLRWFIHTEQVEEKIYNSVLGVFWGKAESLFVKPTMRNHKCTGNYRTIISRY